jgi:hypothetical protein
MDAQVAALLQASLSPEPASQARAAADFERAQASPGFAEALLAVVAGAQAQQAHVVLQASSRVQTLPSTALCSEQCRHTPAQTLCSFSLIRTLSRRRRSFVCLCGRTGRRATIPAAP